MMTLRTGSQKLRLRLGPIVAGLVVSDVPGLRVLSVPEWQPWV